jgi:ABC-type glycerol-3-phosphate transport system substrate-binding protein
LLAAVLALSLLAAACGDDSDDANDDPTPETDGETGGETGGESDGDVTIRWRTRPDNDAEATVYASISDDIDAANGDNVSLAYEPGTSDGANYQDQLVTEIANGTAPDVFWIPRSPQTKASTPAGSIRNRCST